jgi:hypothetical protein
MIACLNPSKPRKIISTAHFYAALETIALSSANLDARLKNRPVILKIAL